MDDDKIQCAKRSCRWTGLQRELVAVPSPTLQKLRMAGHDHACPRCGGKSFYVIERADGAKDRV